MAKKVYVDSSVIGGLHDSEFRHYTEILFKEFQLGLYVPVFSNITGDEIAEAPEKVKQAFAEISLLSEFIEVNSEAVALSQKYIRKGNFSSRMQADTLHIATATVHGIEILVSWNFRDIVNLNKILVYNEVNHRSGYGQIEIRSPREIIHEEKI